MFNKILTICFATTLAISCSDNQTENLRSSQASASRHETSLKNNESRCWADDSIDDQRISPAGIRIYDHEFDHINKRAVYYIERNNGKFDVYLSEFDHMTGLVTKTAGVDLSGLATESIPGIPVGNGPEFGFGKERGVEIYYTKIDPLGRPQLAKATQSTVGGTWQTSILPNALHRGLPLASFNEQDQNPILIYAGKAPGQHVIRTGGRIDNGRSTQELEFEGVGFGKLTGASPGRLLPESHEIVYTTVVEGQLQIVREEPFTRNIDQISNYQKCDKCSPVDLNSVSVVRAPKYDTKDKAYIFYAIVNNQLIDVYLSRSFGDNEFIGSMRPPISPSSKNTFLTDDENFVVGGDSYISIIMASQEKNAVVSPGVTSEIWIAKADMSDNCGMRKVSDGRYQGGLGDPEWMTVGTGTYLYYRELTADGSMFLHQAKTGL